MGIRSGHLLPVIVGILILGIISLNSFQLVFAQEDVLIFDNKFYQISDTVTITLIVPDYDGDPNIIDFINDVEVVSDTDSTGIPVLMIETGKDSKIFVADFQIVAGPSDPLNSLSVTNRDKIIATYLDLSTTAKIGKLYASAENSNFNNKFFGPAVIEVIVKHPPDTGGPEVFVEPYVEVNGKILRLAPAQGGWTGYFADAGFAKLADQIVFDAGIDAAGDSIDFGTFCKSDSADDILQLDNSDTPFDFSDTVSIALPYGTDGLDGTQGTDSFSSCTGDIDITDNNGKQRLNVVRNAPALFPVISDFVNLDPNAWPYVQLYDFVEDSDVVIDLYENSIRVERIVLNFVESDSEVLVSSDKDDYLPNEEVRVKINDYRLNIDPTSRDSWTWATKSGQTQAYYQLFDTSGSSVDGSLGAIDVLQELSSASMGQALSELIIDARPESQSHSIITLDDNLDHEIAGTSIDDAATQGNSIPSGFQPITFIESLPYDGIFSNTDNTGDSNLDIVSNPLSGKAILNYGGKELEILVNCGLPVAVVQDSNVFGSFGEHVSFDGSGSFVQFCPENPLTFSWEQVEDDDLLLLPAILGDDTANPSVFIPTSKNNLQIPIVETYTYELTVTDQIGNTDKEPVFLTVYEDLSHAIFLSSLLGDDMNDGSMTSPVKTFDIALEKAKSTIPPSDIYIHKGSYQNSGNPVTDDVSVYGGYSVTNSNWQRTAIGPTTINGQTQIGLQVENILTPTRIDGLEIKALPGDPNIITKRNSIGINVLNSAPSSLIITNNEIFAEHGAHGPNGNNGLNGANGLNGQDGDRGTIVPFQSHGGRGGLSNCGVLNQGGDGGSGNFPAFSTNGDPGHPGQVLGGGGGPGGTNGGSHGGPGWAAASGVHGLGGSGGPGRGFVNSGYWVGNPGNSGINGQHGHGGGGGGAGDGNNGFSIPSVVTMGGAGGGGGSGGCGGRGGNGGSPGGASFGIFLFESFNTLIAGNKISTQNGGNGGHGGAGGTGGLGGGGGDFGKDELTTSHGDSGGPGGGGGYGGAGAGGGGGSGGISCTIFKSPNSTPISFLNDVIHSGNHGIGGLGGDPGGLAQSLEVQGLLFSIYFPFAFPIFIQPTVTDDSKGENGETGIIVNECPTDALPPQTSIEFNEHKEFQVIVNSLSFSLDTQVTWGGSDVKTTLTSPTGTIIDRDNLESDTLHILGTNYEIFRIENPEQGEWTVDLLGLDIPPGGELVNYDFTVIPSNLPPVAQAMENIIIEASGSDGAGVLLDGSQSVDPNGDILSFSWTNVFGDIISQSMTEFVVIPLGTNEITLIVDDNRGGSDDDSVEIVVQDTIPPVIEVVGNSVVILNVGDVYVDQGATASDIVDGDLTSQIISVNPVDTSKSGTYQVTYDVSDSSGNQAQQKTRSVLVFNPITTDVNSSLNIGPGEIVMISGATVNGNIQIDGGVLTIEHESTIKGNINSINGATIQIHDSIVEGNVKLEYNSISIISGSNIIGNVNFNYVQTMFLFQSFVNGNLKVVNSDEAGILENTITGNTDVSYNDSAVFSDNSINENLGIQNNSECTHSNNTVDGKSKIKDCIEV